MLRHDPRAGAQTHPHDPVAEAQMHPRARQAEARAIWALTAAVPTEEAVTASAIGKFPILRARRIRAHSVAHRAG
jgi:hypothetical protein